MGGPRCPSTAFHTQDTQPVCPEQGQCPVLESPSGVPAACHEPRASYPGASRQPWGPHSSSVASWPVAMEIHWHSSGSTPNQVRPGATLTLGVLLETLSVRSPLPLPPPPIGCYLAFRTGAGLVEGLAPDLGILHGMNYSWRGEDSTRLPPRPPTDLPGVSSDCLALDPDALEQFAHCVEGWVDGGLPPPPRPGPGLLRPAAGSRASGAGRASGGRTRHSSRP